MFFHAPNGQRAAVKATYGQPLPLVLSDPSGH
jgi:hypothetical protein